jgi:hypothetical protein
MDHSPYEIDGRSAGQKISHFLQNLRVHYCVHKIPTSRTTLNQMNLVHILIPNFVKIHLNIIIPSTPNSLIWSLPFHFSN